MNYSGLGTNQRIYQSVVIQGNKTMTHSKNIGVFITMPRCGGGSYQWVVNILQVLNDCAELHNHITIHIFQYSEYEAADELKSAFPSFFFHQIGKVDHFVMGVLRRVACTIPFLIPALRPIFPLNSILAQKQITLVLFPTTNLDSAFCNRKHIFFLADIAHVFYPHFPEVSANFQLRLRHILFKYGLRHADQIVVESKQLRNDIVKYYQADVTKTDVLYQTFSKTLESFKDKAEIDNEQADFKRTIPSRYVFYPAQLWQHKNHKNLLYAMKLVTEEIPDLCLVLAGSRKKGDQRIFRLIEELELQNNVKYLGYVPDKFIPILYKNAQAIVMPTYFGPTNIPTLEAFHYGCPAIISDLPGATEQAGDAALLFNPDSPRDMADKIMLVLKNEDLRQEMVKKAYERLKVLSYENYRNTLVAILDKNLE